MEKTNLLVIQIREGNKIIREVIFYDGEEKELKEKFKELRVEFPSCIFQVVKPILIIE